MKTEEQILLREMHALIRKSCASNSLENPEYQSFQKALLKFFFGAVDVMIDYDLELITLVVSDDDEPNLADRFHPRHTSLVNLNYSDLEETLHQCLELGEKQTRFYKSMLFHYNHVTEQLGAWSA